MIDANLRRLLHLGETATEVFNYTDYYITSTGRVFSGKKKVQYKTLEGLEYRAIVYKELNQFVVRGYKTVCLYDRDLKKRVNKYIHELVYTSFISDYNRAYFKIKHLDHDKLNNKIDNLQLEFRKKDAAFIEEYNRKNKFVRMLKEY